MHSPIDYDALKADLKIPNLIVAMMLVSLAAYLTICFTLGTELQEPLPEITRVKIRTVLYIIAIITFPFTITCLILFHYYPGGGRIPA